MRGYSNAYKIASFDLHALIWSDDWLTEAFSFYPKLFEQFTAYVCLYIVYNWIIFYFLAVKYSLLHWIFITDFIFKVDHFSLNYLVSIIGLFSGLFLFKVSKLIWNVSECIYSSQCFRVKTNQSHAFNVKTLLWGNSYGFPLSGCTLFIGYGHNKR